jgi:hypothetical protein
MKIVLQRPDTNEDGYLLESLLEAAAEGTSGGGAFAWATATGARLLLNDGVFDDFLSRGQFELIVGADSITNPAALTVLGETAAARRSLKARVFCHSRPGTLFHPKFSWFRVRSGGIAITGSGNLTVAGLRGNWEAFAVTRLSAAQTNDLERGWINWVQGHRQFLFTTDSEEARSRAADNQREARTIRRTEGTRRAAKVLEQPELLPPPSTSSVLIAEIPKASTRWNQANFDRENYETFFGAKVGTQRRVLLRHVDENGHVGELEVRPSVEVASQNYRFELSEAAGMHYPDVGRPIGVFLRQPEGLITYRLLMPHDDGYARVEQILADRYHGPDRQVRRVRIDASDLERYWPDSPLLKATPVEE